MLYSIDLANLGQICSHSLRLWEFLGQCLAQKDCFIVESIVDMLRFATLEVLWVGLHFHLGESAKMCSVTSRQNFNEIVLCPAKVLEGPVSDRL